MAALAVAAASAGALVAAGSVPAAAQPASQAAGTVVETAPLPHELWLPGTADAQRITYWSTGADGKPALSSGAYFTPAGTPPPGGWPVIAWAHGTSGVADQCAPSRIGPALPQRDSGYLGHWLERGYAITASDYVGLGTPGMHPYLNTTVEAHSVVDMVEASRKANPALSPKWVVIGQSQGGAAAVATARHATEYGGPDLDYRGGVGTGVPVYLEKVLPTLGPGVPPTKLPANTTGYLLWLTAGLRASHPELGLDSYLTDYGRDSLAVAEQWCERDGTGPFAQIDLSKVYARPLAEIPDIDRVLTDYMGLADSGYDRPLFIGQGLTDVDVPAPGALALAAAMKANQQPVTLKIYPTDHSGTLVQSQADVEPFVDELFSTH
ncbi:lipase family protein [Nocardia africana]|uniref:Secretory lipase n=1 Tax=Nocardia africana TaxID=134964 RepID=A0A378WW73_9NOCA|nr:lipase family protein [Nocardia africana]MCC3313731.1 lipase family protein [Nocardia africana]SUA44885.1 Secretory lipase [Nocardia africana]